MKTWMKQDRCYHPFTWPCLQEAFPRHYSHVLLAWLQSLLFGPKFGVPITHRPNQISRLFRYILWNHPCLIILCGADVFFDLTHPGQNFRGRSGQAFFSALTPGSHILKHMGPSNRMLRVWFLGCQRNCRWVCLKWGYTVHGYYMMYTMTIDNDIQYFTPPSFSQWGKWWCIEIGDTPLTQSHGVSYGWQVDSSKVVKLGIYQSRKPAARLGEVLYANKVS